MQLTLKDVANLCHVTEGRAYKWALEAGLPANRAGGLFRVNPAELLEWASVRRRSVSPEIFTAISSDSSGKSNLAEALRAGAIIEYDVSGDGSHPRSGRQHRIDSLGSCETA